MKGTKKALGGIAKFAGLSGLLGGDVATGLTGTKGLVGKLMARPGVQQILSPAATPVMPTPNDDAARAARRRRMMANQQRTGRQSTLLSNVDTLG